MIVRALLVALALATSGCELDVELAPVDTAVPDASVIQDAVGDAPQIGDAVGDAPFEPVDAFVAD